MSTPTNEQREAEIKARLAAATPGPWAWFGDMKLRHIYLATQKMGRRFVMQFGRWGMNGGQPIFQHESIMRTMPELCDLGLIVAKDYGSREIIDFTHPDADLIANAPADLSWLLSRIEELAKENAAIRYETFTKCSDIAERFADKAADTENEIFAAQRISKLICEARFAAASSSGANTP